MYNDVVQLALRLGCASGLRHPSSTKVEGRLGCDQSAALNSTDTRPLYWQHVTRSAQKLPTAVAALPDVVVHMGQIDHRQSHCWSRQ